ncbi:MAG: tyrosine--tRNA ligase, partial [Clostridiales bacterium]|nr:tyrosine--tRNA ligase [Clostridiales bacterium]
NAADVPTYTLTRAALQLDNRLTTILADCGLCTSRSEARKMVMQGAILVADTKATDVDHRLDEDDIGTDGLLLRKGKKNYCRIALAD